MPATAFKLVRAVFLTIDSAKVSGVALAEPRLDARAALRGYECESFGLVKNQLQREAWIEEALDVARDYDMPLVVVGEEWTSHGLSRSAYKSLNESWGLWMAALERQKKPSDRVHVARVSPQTWRSKVFGKSRPKTRDGLKKLAVVYAQRVLKTPPQLSDDIAEAMCLRVWAERAVEVHELLEVKKLRTRKRKAA